MKFVLSYTLGFFIIGCMYEIWFPLEAILIYRGSNLFTIRAGTTLLDSQDGLLVDVYQVHIHPEYSMYNGGVNDIAVLKLMNPLVFNDVIQPVKLPGRLQNTPGGSPATVLGWGHQHSGGSVMTHLQAVDIVVYSDQDCFIANGYQTYANNICAGVPQGGKGQCNGDSGGPLLVDGQQVGIVSWSKKPCTLKGYPGVYMEVAYYIDWINETINQASSGRHKHLS